MQMFRQTALTDGDRACGHVTQLLEDAEESRGAGGGGWWADEGLIPMLPSAPTARLRPRWLLFVAGLQLKKKEGGK